MRKIAALIILSLAFSFSVCAQNTNVSGTVTDSGGQAWVLGTYEFDFVPSPRFQGQYRQNGVPFNPVSITGNLDATASFSTIPVPDNNTITPSGTQWSVTVCPQATTKCFTSAPIVITGASQSVTSSLVPPQISMSCGSSQKAYADVEVLCQQGGYYYGLLTNTLRLCKVSTPPNTCNTWIDAGSGSASAAGSPPQTQVNDPGNPGHFGGTPCENFPSLTIGPINADCDWHSKGPNPVVDVSRFGARTCNPNATPCISGITASITSGTNSATISSASTFVKGDGVVIYGAGPAQSLTVPTGLAVSNVIARVGTGTGDVAVGAAGATTRCYKVIARDTGGGFTAASAESCTNTGQSTLGSVTVNLTSCSRSGITVTCITASAHPLTTNGQGGSGEVYIAGSISDNSFRGWRNVTSTSDSTHFQFIDSAVNTLNGATTSSTGGTATFFVANHVTWNAVTSAWLYYIYGGASGAETLIGVSRPQGAAAGVTDTTFDDFGSTLMANYTFPPWIPTTPPSTGANDNLSTTITAGAGTTTLTLAANAGATVANAGIRLDAGPGFVAAAASVSGVSFGGGPVYIPSDPTGNVFVINNYCDLTPYKVSFAQSGTIYAHETVALNGSGLRWMGDRASAIGGAGGGGANAWGSYPKFWTYEAVPGMYLNSGFQYAVEGINFQTGVTNGVLDVLVEGGFNGSFKDSQFQTGTSSSDLMGFGLYLRGTTAQSAAGIVMSKMSFGSGNLFDGTSHNTPFFCNNCGDVDIKNGYETARGMLFIGNVAGSVAKISSIHYNGGGTPFITAGSTGSLLITLGDPSEGIIMDTVGHPCVVAEFGAVSVNDNGCGPSGATFQSPSVTGQVKYANGANVFTNSLATNLFPTTSFAGLTSLIYNVTGPGGISVGSNNDTIFVNGPAPAAPTCSVSAGGSVPTGSWVFYAQPIWWDGLEGTISLASTACVTTTGNQTITVNWPASVTVGGSPKFIAIWASLNGGGAAVCGPCGNYALTTTSFVWSNSTFGSPNANFTSLSGPTTLMPGNQGMQAPTLILSGDTLTGVNLSPGGVVATGYQNSVYDNFNRANGGIGSNWTANSGTLSVTSNTVTGANGTNSVSFNNTINPFSDQFSQLTVVVAPTSAANDIVSASVRNGASGVFTAYGYQCQGGIGRRINRTIAGTQAVIAGPVGAVNTPCFTGDVLRLEIQGTTLTAKYTPASTGVTVVDMTVTDANITTGNPGIWMGQGIVSTSADNWSGGNLHPIAQLDTEQDWTQPQHFTQPVTIGATNPVAGTLASGLYSPRYTITGGAAPTCAVTGAGTGATCTLSSFSTDNSGAMQINSGTTPGSSGTWTLTFSAGFPNAAFCTVGPGSGGTTLNARATVFDNTNGTLGVHAGVWDNNGFNINASQSITFIISYVCGGH